MSTRMDRPRAPTRAAPAGTLARDTLALERKSTMNGHLALGRWAGMALAVLVLAGCASNDAGRDPGVGAPAQRTSDPRDRAAEVRAAEIAFARTMAERRFDAFAAFVAEDAVFVNGGKPLRGQREVLAHWARFFERPAAPFAWAPEIIEVLGTGSLAYSEGPVTRPDGVVVARYASTWRRDADGRWRVVFDNGHEVCRCAKP